MSPEERAAEEILKAIDYDAIISLMEKSKVVWSQMTPDRPPTKEELELHFRRILRVASRDGECSSRGFAAYRTEETNELVFVYDFTIRKKIEKE